MSEIRTGRLNEDRARAYCRRVRNDRKREYAYGYLRYLLGQSQGEPNSSGLSVMAAQGVRLQLTAILEGEQ